MSGLARLLVAALFVWLAALLWAPVAVASSDQAIATAGALVYAAAGFVCHQRPERSFALAGRTLPVCARCAGLYASAMIGGMLALAFARDAASSRQTRLLLAAAAIPTVFTVAVERAGWMYPSNLARAIAAIPLGCAAAWVVIGLMVEPRPIRTRI
ncbi:MAG TPA: DUF2085 domain-containing protein [Vicinamibacterales bacterium]|nr:DUF2085 domain-containing protein [Vicinamibacterales bacterium]